MNQPLSDGQCCAARIAVLAVVGWCAACVPLAPLDQRANTSDALLDEDAFRGPPDAEMLADVASVSEMDAGVGLEGGVRLDAGRALDAGIDTGPTMCAPAGRAA